MNGDATLTHREVSRTDLGLKSVRTIQCERCTVKPASGRFLVQMSTKYGRQRQLTMDLCAACAFDAYSWRRLSTFVDERGKEHVFTKQVVTHIKLLNTLRDSVPLDAEARLVVIQGPSSSSAGVPLRTVFARDRAEGRDNTASTNLAQERTNPNVEERAPEVLSPGQTRVVFLRAHNTGGRQ